MVFVGWKVLFFLPLLASHVLIGRTDAGTPLDDNSPEQRHEEEEEEIKPQMQRRLQEEYTVPFTITWDIRIGNGGTDRQPTDEEYEWVVEATEEWFEDIIEKEYGDVDGLDLGGVECLLVPDQTSWTANANPYPHRIFMSCEATFQATSATLVPSPADMLVTLNANYPVRDFIVNYLLTTGDDSVFHFSSAVSYLTNSNVGAGAGGGGGGGPTPSNPTPPNPRPTPAPVTIPSFTSAWVLPFRLEFNLDVSDNIQDRQPTEAEYDGFKASAQQWLLDSLRNAYADEDEFFVSDVLSSIMSTDWDTSNDLPHQIVMDAYAIYNADNRADVPYLADFFATLRSDDVELVTFLTDYLRFAQPDGNIFRSTTSGQYGSQQNGPIIAAGNTPNPAVAPSPPIPTPPPARATPAPVNPNNIIATVPTESNWTYTIGDFGVTDRQPTQAEYEGLVEATHEWLNRIYNEYYNINNQDQNLPQFVGIETALVKGIYQPGTDDPPHLVVINFNVTYALDENDPEEVVPFIDDIFDVIGEADLNQYVFLYVHGAEPEGSVFHGVNSVNWEYSVNDYTYVPRPTKSPSASSVPDEGVPGFTGVDRAKFENAEWVPVSMEYRYRLVNNDAHGAPSQEEWDGLVEAMRNFWIETMTNEYQSDPNAEFVIVDAKWELDSTSYDETQDFPYKGRLLTDILFTEGSTTPSSVDMRQQMSNAIPGSNLIGTYLRNAMPVYSLFRQTLEIQWDF